MPYRRLPNTDAARIRALETALNNEEFSNINNLPFSLNLRQKIEFFLPKFKTAIANSQCARDKQNKNSQKYGEFTKKAKLYISHFLQVLNFTIIRGELKPVARTFYGIDEHDTKLPPWFQTKTCWNGVQKLLPENRNALVMAVAAPCTVLPSPW